MNTTARSLGLTGLLVGGLAIAGSATAEPAEHRNLTTGGLFKPGVYGRIAVRNSAPPPPVIYPQPVIASDALVPPGVRPVYLYVPPGQVRKWKQHCGKWSACEQPVLFVRVDDSPSRWGGWKKLREEVAIARP